MQTRTGLVLESIKLLATVPDRVNVLLHDANDIIDLLLQLGSLGRGGRWMGIVGGGGPIGKRISGGWSVSRAITLQLAGVMACNVAAIHGHVDSCP